ncbi:hypothetical protein AMAG_06983 [Allomyces macrogynus ATCC 38327]|uniref:Zinc/iron permease n=1 Tax=Allomyces macrogynus (strain ATCC 38327) TaxID=578462 RepID=A0A0L0SFM1_ALLM3|nr:hypothetical protein AMAG_06983 [Allomyces macrogynus ATCC 38327]|eukprot:KNE61234.1 hypothetical protein AMAG_06983 [Allomyces macrogynus ATCC 38327]
MAVLLALAALPAQLVAAAPATRHHLAKRHTDGGDEHDDHGDEKLSTGGVWAAAMGAELIVCAFAVAGIVMVPYLAKHPRVNHAVMALLVGLAVGTLLGDALIHMIPDSMGLSSGNPVSSEKAVWIALVVLAGAYLFFLVEHVLHSVGHAHSHDHFGGGADDEHAHGHGHGHPAATALPTSASKDLEAKMPLTGPTSTTPDAQVAESSSTSSPRAISATFDPAVPAAPAARKHGVQMRESEYRAADVKPVAWLIMFGDAVHNSLDGVAIGVSFASSWRLGVSTTIAILLHELPHELGDYAVLLTSGIPKWRAALYNAACNATSFVGVAIGIGLYEAISEDAQAWVLAFTAGGFLYISLSSLVPMLFQMTYKHDLPHHHSDAGMVSSTPCGAADDDDVEQQQQPSSGHDHAHGHGHLHIPFTRTAIITQHIGALTGIVIMLMMALYGENISV